MVDASMTDRKLMTANMHVDIYFSIYNCFLIELSKKKHEATISNEEYSTVSKQLSGCSDS